MNEKINEIFIDELKKYLPKGKKLIPYLMDELDLGKESAYRRVRNNTPFSAAEIIRLSTKLGFSLDDIVGKTNSNRVFFDIKTNSSLDDPIALYQDFMGDTPDIMRKINGIKNAKAIILHNRTPLLFIAHRKNILRLVYYRWMHQTFDVPLNFRLSDVVLPKEILSMSKQMNYNYIKTGEMSVILDKNSFYSMLKEVIYYYKRGHITNEELEALSEDFSKMIDNFEILTSRGENEVGTKFNIYLSSLLIEGNSGYFEFENKTQVMLWSFGTPTLVITKPDYCKIHKSRMESFFKFSTLITKCNESERAEYINTQRNHIKEILNLLN